MHYRDLVPSRLGGAMIASHIRIPDGGPVPDMVHFHKVGFQLIFCIRGWVDVVYEDQGGPRRLAAGDCFIQPPRIRHRVLEASDGEEALLGDGLLGGLADAVGAVLDPLERRVDLLEPDGSVTMAALVAADPEKGRLARRQREMRPIRPTVTAKMMRVPPLRWRHARRSALAHA